MTARLTADERIGRNTSLEKPTGPGDGRSGSVTDGDARR